MKKSLFLIIVLTVVMALAFGISASAQSYTLASNGQVTATAKKAKAPDQVHSVVNGVTFYKGAKGAVYYWKKSKKTGKDYKCYVQKQK